MVSSGIEFLRTTNNFIIMTLILTEISNFGIVMAADSAVTEKIVQPNGTIIYRVLTGVRKLQVIDKLNAGVSVWGEGGIPPNTLNNMPTDIWLEGFINSQRSNYNSLHDFALLLQNELRNQIPPINVQNHPLGTIGFHLAGFIDYQGNPIPTFYHIHNGQSQALAARGITVNPTIVNANHDLPPNIVRQMLLSGRSAIIRNGDFTIYAALFQHIDTFLRNLSQYSNLTIPHSRDLRERAEWLKFQIRTMSELYRLSNLHLPTIGDKIDVLLLTPQGVDECGLTI